MISRLFDGKCGIAVGALLGILLLCAAPSPGAERKLGAPKAKEEEGTGEPFMGAVPIDSTGADYREPARLARLIDEIKHSPFTDVIVQVRSFGEVYYDSKIDPKALGVSEKFDPLAELIQGLKKGASTSHPHRVYAWIEALRVANANRAVPVPANHVTQAHPGWLSRNSNLGTNDPDGSQYLEPGLESVRNYLDSIVTELAGRYDLEGIVIDGLQYPGVSSDWGYHPDVLQKWRDSAGEKDQPAADNPSWRQFRRDILTQTIEGMTKAAKKAKPAVKIAVVGLAEGHAPGPSGDFRQTEVFNGALQNWPEWMAKKTVDFVVMQNYRIEGQESEDFDGWDDYAVAETRATGVNVVVAIAGGKNISLDVLQQVRRARREGLLGVALATFREPVQDAASRELFFRTLGTTELTAGAQRLPLAQAKELAAATALPPAEPAFPPASVNGAQPQKKLDTPPPPVEADRKIASAEKPPPGPEAAPKKDADLDKMLAEASERRRQKSEPIMEPSESAREFLKHKFPNIF